MPQEERDWLSWLADLPQEELLDLLALCTACLILVPTGPAPAASAMERLVMLDMRQWWEPTPEGFLSHVSKAQIAEAMKEGGVGPSVPAPSEMKKAELVVVAAANLLGKGWLPEPLRAPAPA